MCSSVHVVNTALHLVKTGNFFFFFLCYIKTCLKFDFSIPVFVLIFFFFLKMFILGTLKNISGNVNILQNEYSMIT